MEKYELVDIITGERYELLGASKDQVDSFDYKVNNEFTKSVHISHINVDCMIVYDKRYVLTNSDVDYFYKDLRGMK